MRKIRTCVIITSVLLLATFAVFTSASTEPKSVETGYNNEILLKNAQFYTNATMPVITSSALRIQQYPADTEGYYIMQFTGYVLDEWKQTVKNTGAVLYDYIPNNAYLVRMNASVKAQVEALDYVAWVGIYQPAYRIEPGLQLTSTSADADKTIIKQIRVLLFDAKDNRYVSNEIIGYGGTIEDNAGNIIKLSLENSKIADIAAIHGVYWIEEYRQCELLNDVAANITNVYTVSSTYGLNGSGQIICVADSGLDTGVNNASMHDDLEGRIIALFDHSDNGIPDINSGHGTHVAGSVLGNGSCSGGQFSGMAPGAQLVFQALENADESLNTSNITWLFQQAYDQGAKIHTNSWGADVNGQYTLNCYYLDKFVWEHPDMLILFAAGNEGVDIDSSDGVIDTDSMNSPATAKNCISVGASENDRLELSFTYSTLTDGGSKYPVEPIKNDKMSNDPKGLAAFSSRGPTDDGRIKPDIVAPGTFIISTNSSVANGIGWGVYNDNDKYIYMGGTSMSTPITAGAAALIRQYYTQNESITPSAALLKATMINGAYNMAPGQYGTGSTQEIQTRPDNAAGWGRVDIENTLFPAHPRTMCYYDNISLDTSESWNVSCYSDNSPEPLRVTLVWTDYPASVYVAVALVNNLDLTVSGPNGIYYGNGAIDDLNNVENVELLSPAAGQYNITVDGKNIPEGPQPFALVISGALNLPPSAADEFPSDNSYTNNNTTVVAVNITDINNDLNVSSINMTINNTFVSFTNTTITNGCNIRNQTVLPYEDGIINCIVRACDNASNQLTYSWSFIIDTISPVSNSPANTTFSADTTAYFTNWTLFDLYSGYYRILLNGTRIVSPTKWTNNTNLTVPVNTTMGVGSFNYTVQYNDSAGNNGTQNTVFITIIDTSAPRLCDQTPADGTSNLTPTISINASDGGSFVNVSSANMTVNGMQVVLANTSSGITCIFYNTTTTPYNHIDTVNVTFNVSDNVGYLSNKSWMFYIDDVTPTISISSPNDGYSTSSSSITVSGTLNGTGSPPSVTVNNNAADTTLTNFSGTFTATAVPLSMGINTIYANISDAAGNTNTTFITITRVSPPGSPSSSSGGGGGGGSSGEAFENIELKETKRIYVSKYDRVIFVFEKSENVLEFIKYRALKNAGTIAATVEILKNTSTLVNHSPSGIVYNNINIWVGLSGYSSGKNMEDPVIGFRVEKKWIEDNDIDLNSIRLNRYSDDVWTPLSTEKTDDNELSIYFESITPGFSPFAITGEKAQVISSSVIPETTEITPPASDEATLISSLTDIFSSGLSYLLIGIIGLVIIVFGIKYAKKKGYLR